MVARNITYGNDIFKTLGKSNSEEFFEVTYWDLWISIAHNQ
jgi:hypothetical protein